MLNGHLEKKIGHFMLDVSLSIGRDELLVILGASGCGKSTLLNCMAGFMMLDRGFLELDKKVYEDREKDIWMPIYKRQVAYIQQGHTLFPHLNVKENILYSVPKSKRNGLHLRYKELLSLLGIEALEHRKPNTLSGGEEQRVTIGRSLMMNPKLILWDEPFSALDHIIRDELRMLVISLKKQLGIPMIFVTHDLEEAFQLADHLGVMSNGKILQMGERDHVFNCPLNENVGKILGVSNSFLATYVSSGDDKCDHVDRLLSFQCDDMIIRGWDVDSRLEKAPIGSRLHIGIRPEQILYVKDELEEDQPLEDDPEGDVFDATVLSVAKHLEYYRIRIKMDGLKKNMIMDVPRGINRQDDIQEAQRIKVLIKHKRIILMDILPPALHEKKRTERLI